MTDEEKKISHSASARKYARLNTKYVGLQLNIDTDRDILQVLDQCRNKQGFIKKAIRDYIKIPENLPDPIQRSRRQIPPSS